MDFSVIHDNLGYLLWGTWPDGPLGGAALDVYHREPLWRDHPFVIEFDNVIITPHIAGATRESIAKHTAMIAADLQRYVAGEPLLYQWR